MDDLTTPNEPDVPPMGSPSEPDQTQTPQTPKVDPKLKALNTRIAKLIKSEIAGDKQYIDRLIPIWKTNVEMRMGGYQRIDPTVAHIIDVPFDVIQSTESSINPDWALTKTKIANLYSQNPEVRLTHDDKQYGPAIPPFAKALNYELSEKRAGMGDAMEEVLSDVVNAAGIGAVEVGYAARFKSKLMPVADQIDGPSGPIPVKSIPNDVLQGIIEDHKKEGLPFPTQTVKAPTDQRFYITRISPQDLIIQKAFAGSNFDKASYTGRRGRYTWSEGKAEFDLKDEDKDSILETLQERERTQTLKVDPAIRDAQEPAVSYQKVYYWRYKYDPDEPHFDCLWKLVFVDGLDEPAIHEPWKGQEYDDQIGAYVGNKKSPVRILTLTYISDNAIPPSDSEAGRPQVNDMRKSRTQIFENRERSRPVRWFDDTRVDPEQRDLLMQGLWQGMIPVKGDGTRIIGEIARASFPQENLELDNVTKADLQEVWQLGPNQMGAPSRSDQTAAETDVVQSNFSTRMGQERARVVRFITGIAEVMGGWMALFSDFPNLSQEERQAMQGAWDLKHIAQDIVFTVRPDSTVLVDSDSRIKMLLRLLSFIGKSGLINPAPIITELIELHGLDPSVIMIPPNPPEQKPNVTLALKGADLQNPLTLLIYMKQENLQLSPQDLEMAKKILTANLQDQPPQPQGMPGMPGMPPQGPQPPQLGPQSGQKMLPPAQGPQPVARPNPDWQLMDRIAKRTRDAGGE